MRTPFLKKFKRNGVLCMKFSFIHSDGKVEIIYVEATSDFEFIESVTGTVEYKLNNSTGSKEAYVYVEDDSDSEFIMSVVRMLRYEINNERAQKDWCRDSLDDDKFINFPSLDSTEDTAFRNISVEALRAAIEDLKPDERFIINRLYLDPDKVTQVELAKELGVEYDKLNKRVAVLVKIKLKKLIEKHE